jgi:PII-like signaling protein
MRALEREGILVRVFVGESDQWHHQPLATALVERLRREGFAGATVLRGIAGFGAHSVLHTTSILRLSQDLPVLIEMVESPERVPRLQEILDEMVGEGLVTMEKVQVLKYSARKTSPGD